MTIQFGGLATGLDTSTIIEKLMDVERAPVTRLEADKTWLNNRLTAFTDLDTRLKSFADTIKDLNYSSTLLKRSVKQSSTEHLTATVSPKALSGASYQVEVVSLAQVQKSVSLDGYADKAAMVFGTGNLRLTVGSTSRTVAIGSGKNSLEGIAKAINQADIGVSAAIINNGDAAEPYQLILTGEDVATGFSLDASGLVGGAAFGLDEPIQEAHEAHIKVDTLNIYSKSNTLKEAIPGVTLDLLKAETGKTTTLNINVDKAEIQSAIAAFAEGYNEVIGFITSQSVINGEGGGVLGGDSGVSAIKRRLQNMLTEASNNSGGFATLSQLGFETQKDGTLKVNESTLGAAINDNLDGVVNLLAGKEGVTGVITKFKDFLYSATNSTSGMLKGRKDSINTNLKKIDTKIASTEARLEQRQKTMEAQFSAMETLVSGLNSQSTYLNQQMEALSNMMNYRSR